VAALGELFARAILDNLNRFILRRSQGSPSLSPSKRWPRPSSRSARYERLQNEAGDAPRARPMAPGAAPAFGRRISLTPLVAWHTSNPELSVNSDSTRPSTFLAPRRTAICLDASHELGRDNLPRTQIMHSAFIQSHATTTLLQPLDPIAQLCQRDDAQVDSILVSSRQPLR